MKKKIITVLIIIVSLILGFILYYKISNSNPSEEKIREGIVRKDMIRDNIQNVMNGIENPDANYKISIAEARDKAIIIFNSLGEKDLNKDNVQVIEIDRSGKKYYLIRSSKNSAEVEINTGKVTIINNVIQ